MMRRKSIAGFTLVELAIVVALIAILGVMAAPSFRDYMRSQRLGGACRQLFTDLTNARAQAISQNYNIIVELTNSTDYKIIRDVNNNGALDMGETVVARSLRPEYGDVTFAPATGSFTPKFFPNGTGDNGTINVTSSSLSITKTITISTAGRIKIN